MSLPAIREAARGLIEANKAGLGLAQVLGRPPERFPALAPVLWLGVGRAAITGGNRQMWEWDVPITVGVNRRGAIEDELAVTEAIYLPLVALLETNYTLGGVCGGSTPVELVQGPIPFGPEQELFGFTLRQRFWVTRIPAYAG